MQRRLIPGQSWLKIHLMLIVNTMLILFSEKHVEFTFAFQSVCEKVKMKTARKRSMRSTEFTAGMDILTSEPQLCPWQISNSE